MAHGTAHIGRDRYRTQIEVGGHPITADEPEALGGANAGPAPYDLILAGLGACTAITLRMYADRKAWPLETLDVDLRLLGGPDDRRIARTLTMTGLDDAQQMRMAEVAEKTPVTLTLKGGIPIHTRLT
ncbi:MAG: osmotically inducible protein C [Sphingobium sp.]|nr:MAG: osmotically inducible protein C [Sphingobium sp.]